MAAGTGFIGLLFHRLWFVILGIRFWGTPHGLWNRYLFQIRKVKIFIGDLNKAFESRVRLGMMSILLVNDFVDFARLKEQLQITDGNLASHIAALEKLGYIEIKKQFIGKKPNTSYLATKAGKKAFTEHLDALEKLIKQSVE